MDQDLIPPTRQALWPSIIPQSRDVEKLTHVSSGKIWVEAGLSQRSLMPFAESHGAWYVYDRRPWAYTLLSRMHSPEVRRVFLSLKETHLSRPFEATVLREMLKLANEMKTDNDIGVVLFILWITGGISGTTPTVEQSLNCTMIAETPPTIFERHIWAHFFTMSYKMDDEQFIRKIVADMKETETMGYHININWTKTHPTPERIKAIGDSLIRRGVSWSFMFFDRLIAKEVASDYRSAKIGDTLYVIGDLED